MPDSTFLIGDNAFWSSDIQSLTFEGNLPDISSLNPNFFMLGTNTFENTSYNAVQGAAWKKWAEEQVGSFADN